MNDFITVASFTLPSELAIIRARLEAEGIECQVKDELTVQVNNLYSHALGGIKLQVRKDDALRALQLLKEEGYYFRSPYRTPAFVEHIIALTDRISILQTLSLGWRFAVLLMVLLFTVVVLVFILIY